jgi:N-acyl-D-aspartate/D-glutamate deacylase
VNFDLIVNQFLESYDKTSESTDSIFLTQLADADQKERNEWLTFNNNNIPKNKEKFKQAVDKWLEQKNRTDKDDIFNDKERQKEFMTKAFNMEFKNFNNKDWNNFWLLTQHCDTHRDFQRKALDIIAQYLGKDNSYYKYLFDRIQCGTEGTQTFGTQKICNKDIE